MSDKKYQIKFFDGETPESISAHARIVDQTLVIENQQGQQIDIWPLKNLSFDPNHLDRSFIMCTSEKNARIQIVDPDLSKYIPSLQINSLNQFLETKKFIAISIVVLIGLFVLTFFSLERISRSIAKKIPTSWENKIANNIKYEDYFDICVNKHPVLDELNEKFSPAMQSLNTSDIKILVAKMSMANAFALPGGTIVLSNKLLAEAETFEEIIGILAHEKGHLHERHHLQGLVRASLVTALFSVVTGDVSAFVIDPSLLAGFVNLKYDRMAETEADQYAINFLKAQNISNLGLIHFFQRQEPSDDEVDKALVNIPDFISTHPNDEKRIDLLRKNQIDKTLTALPFSFKYFDCELK